MGNLIKHLSPFQQILLHLEKFNKLFITIFCDQGTLPQTIMVNEPAGIGVAAGKF